MNEHFDDRKIRTEAAKKFLDDLNARQEEDIRRPLKNPPRTWRHEGGH